MLDMLIHIAGLNDINRHFMAVEQRLHGHAERAGQSIDHLNGRPDTTTLVLVDRIHRPADALRDLFGSQSSSRTRRAKAGSGEAPSLHRTNPSKTRTPSTTPTLSGGCLLGASRAVRPRPRSMPRESSRGPINTGENQWRPRLLATRDAAAIGRLAKLGVLLVIRTLQGRPTRCRPLRDDRCGPACSPAPYPSVALPAPTDRS